VLPDKLNIFDFDHILYIKNNDTTSFLKDAHMVHSEWADKKESTHGESQ
jgi:hypothetical protein